MKYPARAVALPRSERRSGHSAAFTIVELLVVVGIISFLAVVSLPNIVSTGRGMQLTQGGQLIETQLQLARQRALANNRSVEVRFYSLGASGTAPFTAIQSFLISSSGALATPTDKAYSLPGTMIMDSGNGQTTDNGSTLSTLLNQPTPTRLKPASLLSPQSLPTSGTNYTCVAFRFRPDGTTNLTPVSNSWFVTVHAGTDGDNLTKAPVNYYTVQVDAYNGHTYDFHP